MSKDEFLMKLQSIGFDAINDHGSIIVIHDDERTWKKLQKIAKQEGYDMSYGWRRKREV